LAEGFELRLPEIAAKVGSYSFIKLVSNICILLKVVIKHNN